VTPQRRWPDGSDEVSAELRRALDEAALRGPDDVTLRRGWAAVANPPEPPRARRGFWFAGGVFSSAALGILATVWLWPRLIQRAPSAPASALAHAESVVGPGARELTLEGGVQAVIGRSGVMRIDDGAPRVESGEVRFSVPHRRPGHPFVVRAEGYRVVVVGTRFGVSVQDSGVLVDVDEGIVEVWEAATQRRVARLTPGERWHSPAEEAAQAPAAPAAAPATPARASGFAVPSLLAHAPHAHARPSGRRVALGSPGAASDGAASARAALAAGDPARALQMYRAQAQGTGPAAENAAYEIGKVLNERMGRPAAAVAAWRHYRAAYPDGILRIEADVSIIETLAKSGDEDGALAEATEFLRQHPDSERRAEIARLAGDIDRARGDCRHAVGLYQVAVSAVRPRDVVETAAAHRADCLARLAGGPAR
jgi:hypothetical protein